MRIRFKTAGSIFLTTILGLSLLAPGQARGHGSRKLGISYSTGYDAQAAVDNMGPAEWYYNWTPTNSLNLHGKQFVPMLELPTDFTPENLARVKTYGNTLLFMSEPPIKVDEAVALWPQAVTTGMRLGSPAASPSDGGWLDQFLAALKVHGYKQPDFICVHLYPDVGSPADPAAAADAMVKSLQHLHEKYGKPLWITEWGLPPWGHPATAADNLAFMQAMLPRLEALPYVERYCWWTLNFPYPGYTINLTDKDGVVLPLGSFYAQFGSHPTSKQP
jgi:hypothetical protein